MVGDEYHIGTQSCRCHCGEIRCAGVVFASSYDCYPSHLACYALGELQAALKCTEPLWNFSSMGGTIFRTFIRMSRVACDILGASPDIGSDRTQEMGGVCGAESVKV